MNSHPHRTTLGNKGNAAALSKSTVTMLHKNCVYTLLGCKYAHGVGTQDTRAVI